MISPRETDVPALSLSEVLRVSVSVLWKDWPMDLQVTSLVGYMGASAEFSLHGTCPHCREKSAFLCADRYQKEHIEGESDWQRWYAPMRCQSCKKLILGIVRVKQPRPKKSGEEEQPYWVGWNFVYEAHYPVGSPDDSVATEVPTPIAIAFKEALRCRWVDAHGATVLMCRRSLQISCDREKAIGDDLFKQIDDLVSKQRITATLKQMAHRIRLLGKKGAHGDFADIDDTITEKDADDALTFMRHYLDHVYVLPERLKAPV